MSGTTACRSPTGSAARTRADLRARRHGDPAAGARPRFEWGVWVSLSENGFKRAVDAWEIEAARGAAGVPADAECAPDLETDVTPARPASARRPSSGRTRDGIPLARAVEIVEHVPMVRIRHVEAHESERLREIRLASLQADPDAFGATYASDAARPESWWQRLATLSAAGAEQRTFVVVDDEDRWLGLALVRRDDDTPGDAVLNAMWVAPEARSRGAAQGLCEACAQWAAEHGFNGLSAAVVVGNVPARRTYESCGFVLVRADTWTRHGRTLREEVLRRPLRAGGRVPSRQPE